MAEDASKNPASEAAAEVDSDQSETRPKPEPLRVEKRKRRRTEKSANEKAPKQAKSPSDNASEVEQAKASPEANANVSSDGVSCNVCLVTPTKAEIYSCCACNSLICSDCLAKSDKYPFCNQSFQEERAFLRSRNVEKIIAKLQKC